MKININAVKCGNVINVSLGGKLHKKICADASEADSLFKLILEAKSNPTDENIKNVKIAFNLKLRKLLFSGIEVDVENGEAYLAGFNTPIPEKLMDIIQDYHDNGYPLDAIINFWKLLMINPDKRVRTSLFNFINKHDFSLTDNGYMIVYKAVYHKVIPTKLELINKLEEFVTNKHLHVKKTWKEKPNNYVVYQSNDDKSYAIAKFITIEKWDEKVKNIEILGKLGDLYDSFVKTSGTKIVPEIVENKTIYTDKHSQTMTIIIGSPVVMDRKECDGDPSVECSYGLHVGATKYVESYADNKSTILACLVNPANVVAVPNYDNSKMRVTEYFPFAVATYIDNKIDIVEQQYFEDDYTNFEVAEINNLIAKVKADELPINSAKNSDVETRPMSELMKMLENRLYDISK